MTTAEKNMRLTELSCEANNLRRRIDNNLIPVRRKLDGKVNPYFLEGLDIALEQAEDKYISLCNQIEAIRASLRA